MTDWSNKFIPLLLASSTDCGYKNITIQIDWILKNHVHKSCHSKLKFLLFPFILIHWGKRDFLIILIIVSIIPPNRQGNKILTNYSMYNNNNNNKPVWSIWVQYLVCYLIKHRNHIDFLAFDKGLYFFLWKSGNSATSARSVAWHKWTRLRTTLNCPLLSSLPPPHLLRVCVRVLFCLFNLVTS